MTDEPRLAAPAVELMEVAGGGRRFLAADTVHLGDADPRGRLRLDAVARLLQDVASDDVADTGLDGATAWVVRRTLLEVHRAPVLGERLEVVTFCSGTGRAWAERRTSIVGAGGGRVEAVSLWIHIDSARGRPTELGPAFHRVYGPAAGGRRVSTRLRLPGPPEKADVRPWPVRAVDLDVLGHVNNAAHWPIVEELLVGSEARAGTAELEFLRPVDPGHDPRLHLADGTGAWLVVDGVVHSAARWTPAHGQAGRLAEDEARG